MPNISIDIDELEIEPNQVLWIHLNRYTVHIRGDGLLEIYSREIGKTSRTVTLDELTK